MSDATAREVEKDCRLVWTRNRVRMGLESRPVEIKDVSRVPASRDGRLTAEKHQAGTVRARPLSDARSSAHSIPTRTPCLAAVVSVRAANMVSDE
jgi:hypothetical protein